MVETLLIFILTDLSVNCMYSPLVLALMVQFWIYRVVLNVQYILRTVHNSQYSIDRVFARACVLAEISDTACGENQFFSP